MRILKFNSHFLNPIMFTLISAVFLVSFSSVANGVSLFNGYERAALLIKPLSFYILILVILLTLQFRLVRLSKKFALMTYLILFGFMIISTFKDANKLLVLLSFAYLFFSFYFYTQWESFLSLAALNPLYQDCDIEKTTLFKIKGVLKNRNTGEAKDVYLTNLDKRSGFLFFNDNIIVKNSDTCELELIYEGVRFASNCVPVTGQLNGMGFTYNPDEMSRSIGSLYKICLDRQIFKEL